jgi:hypothetical protein
MYAVSSEIDLVRGLLAAGAHTDCRNDDGETVSIRATNEQNKSVVEGASADD